MNELLILKGHKVYLVNGKISLVQCIKTGRFVKHSLVKKLVENVLKMRTIFVLMLCIIANIFALFQLIS